MLKRLAIAALVAVMAVPMFVAPASAEATRVDVRAVDYELKGIPAELKVGAHRFTFENKGENVHEVVIFRRKASSDATWNEIFQMEEEEAMEHVAFVGATFAKPGKTGEPFRAYMREGKHIALCFVQNDDHSKPHFMKGMVRKFHVSK